MNAEDRILALERGLARVQVWLVILAFLILASIVRGNDAELANVDRRQFPAEQWPDIYYLSLETVPAERRADAATALRLLIPSTSRQVVLEACTPITVGETLWRIHLDQLGWQASTWRTVIAANPYAAAENSLIVRADWLLLQLADAHESPAYYSLLFGSNRKRGEVLASLDVDGNAAHSFGMIESASAVNVQGVRWIENRPVPRGYAWLTRDAVALTGERDMIEHPDGLFVHDGEEIIIGLRKVSLATGLQGALQVYFLADGDGNLVGRAPVDLVSDSTEFRGFKEIRAPGSCIQCHDAGMNPLKENQLRRYLAAGVEAYAADPQLQAFHFADLSTEIQRDAADYQATVLELCGVDSKTAAERFRRAVDAYDRPLTLADAAGELRTTADELRLALAWGDANGVQLSARVAGLAHDQPIPRKAFEGVYLACRDLVKQWETQK